MRYSHFSMLSWLTVCAREGLFLVLLTKFLQWSPALLTGATCCQGWGAGTSYRFHDPGAPQHETADVAAAKTFIHAKCALALDWPSTLKHRVCCLLLAERTGTNPFRAKCCAGMPVTEQEHRQIMSAACCPLGGLYTGPPSQALCRHASH